MRAQYASGVLDFFLRAGLRFPYVIGVSAGISNAASYVAGQFGRNRLERQYRNGWADAAERADELRDFLSP